VIGAPVHDNAPYLPQALDSLLAQTFRDFTLLVLDDASTDATPEICRRYAEGDPRVVYVRSDVRLGLVESWRRCVELARELHPEAPYFAWASDHDVWHERWLERMVAELDGRPDVALVYPVSIRIGERGELLRTHRRFDTIDVEGARPRLRASVRRRVAGGMVYGGFRKAARVRAGPFRRVLNPDRLLLVELALAAPFSQVPEVLWERRFRGIDSWRRQRGRLFGGRPPWYAYLPPEAQHLGVLAWRYAVRGAGRPELGRAEGALVPVDFALASVAHHADRVATRTGRRARKAGKRLRRRLRPKTRLRALRARVRG
jgi:glycosyltransferase involved in cell wall biosynthesis